MNSTTRIGRNVLLRPRLIAILAIGTTTVLSAAMSSAQITASQGVTPVQSNRTSVESPYHSPMVLTIPLPPDARDVWGRDKWTDSRTFQHLRDFRCDGIAITDMQLRSAMSSKRLRVEIKGKFDSIRGRDKRVDMKLEFLSDDEVIGVGYADKLKAPEAKDRQFTIGLDFRDTRVQNRTPTHVRITFSDYDD